MYQLGKLAMRNRRLAMQKIGWLADCSRATQKDWMDCISSLREVCGLSYQDIAWFFGGFTYQGIQHDFHVLGLDNTVKRGGDRSSNVYIINNQKGTIAQHCARSGKKYPGVYSKMRKLMDQDGNLSRLDALIAALGTVKVRQSAKPKAIRPVVAETAKTDEPTKKHEWHGKESAERIAYLTKKAKGHQNRYKQKRKTDRLPTYNGKEYCYELTVRDLMAEGCDDIAACDNKPKIDSLPGEEWY